MYRAIAFLVLLSGATAFAGPQQISVPSDPNAMYFVVARGGTAIHPTMVTRRVGPSGTSFSSKLFDCNAGTFKYLGEGDTMEQMKRSSPSPRMGSLVDGSISYYHWRFACGL